MHTESLMGLGWSWVRDKAALVFKFRNKMSRREGYEKNGNIIHKWKRLKHEKLLNYPPSNKSVAYLYFRI